MSDESFSEVEETHKSEGTDFPIQTHQRLTRGWLTPLLLGTGLGIVIAFVGKSILGNSPASQPVAATDTNVVPALTVTVVPVGTTRVTRTLKTTGTIAARDLIPVLPQTNGLQIEKIPDYVKQGAIVQKGQVLAILDDSLLQTQIDQAQADIESRKADVETRVADVKSRQAEVVASQAVVQQRRADLAQARARLEEAQKNFQRYQKLADAGAITLQELDNRSYTVKTSVESVRLAQESVNSALANVGSAQANIINAKASVNKAKADVRSSVAKLQQLKTQLAQTIVRTPVSGIIAEKLVRVGDVTGVPPQTRIANLVGGSQKLFSIIKEGNLELQAEVPEIYLPQITVGAATLITSNFDRSVRLQGKVRDIEPLVNDKNRKAIVKIDLPQTDVLKLGMFASAEITTSTGMGMAVPQKSVLFQADGSVVVFTLSATNTVQAQKVVVGDLIDGNRVEIKSGLEVGKRIVVDGAGYLKNGDIVRVAG